MLLLGACAASASGDAPVERTIPYGYMQTGVISACVNVDKNGAITALDEMRFLVRGDNATYLSIADAPCIGSAGKRIGYSTHQSSICRNDIVDVIDADTGEKITSCKLGGFETLLQTQAAPAHNRRD